MPKYNETGGQKFKKKKKDRDKFEKRIEKPVLKELGQEYGYIIKNYGGGRADVFCEDKVTRSCILRRRLGKSIKNGDIILISFRDYQKDVSDVIIKYTPEQVGHLVYINAINNIKEFEKNLEDGMFGNKTDKKIDHKDKVDHRDGFVFAEEIVFNYDEI